MKIFSQIIMILFFSLKLLANNACENLFNLSVYTEYQIKEIYENYIQASSDTSLINSLRERIASSTLILKIGELDPSSAKFELKNLSTKRKVNIQDRSPFAFGLNSKGDHVIINNNNMGIVDSEEVELIDTNFHSDFIYFKFYTSPLRMMSQYKYQKKLGKSRAIIDIFESLPNQADQNPVKSAEMRSPILASSIFNLAKQLKSSQDRPGSGSDSSSAGPILDKIKQGYRFFALSDQGDMYEILPHHFNSDIGEPNDTLLFNAVSLQKIGIKESDHNILSWQFLANGNVIVLRRHQGGLQTLIFDPLSLNILLQIDSSKEI